MGGRFRSQWRMYIISHWCVLYDDLADVVPLLVVDEEEEEEKMKKSTNRFRRRGIMKRQQDNVG